MSIKGISDPRCSQMSEMHKTLVSTGWEKKKHYIEGSLMFAYYEREGYGINISLGYDEDIQNEYGY